MTSQPLAPPKLCIGMDIIRISIDFFMALMNAPHFTKKVGLFTCVPT